MEVEIEDDSEPIDMIVAVKSHDCAGANYKLPCGCGFTEGLESNPMAAFFIPCKRHKSIYGEA